MNGDAGRGVTIDASVGAKSDLVLPIGIGLLAAVVGCRSSSAPGRWWSVCCGVGGG